MKVMRIAPAIIGQHATFQDVKDYILKSGHRPLRREEVAEPCRMAVYLGGELPVSDDRTGLSWDRIAETTGWVYPIAS